MDGNNYGKNLVISVMEEILSSLPFLGRNGRNPKI